jgi:hypothetical protein
MKLTEILFVVVLILSSLLFTFRQRGVTRSNVIILGVDYLALLTTLIVVGAELL